MQLQEPPAHGGFLPLQSANSFGFLEVTKKDDVRAGSGLPGYDGGGKIHWVNMGKSARRKTPEAEPFGNVSGKTGRKKGITRLKRKNGLEGSSLLF